MAKILTGDIVYVIAGSFRGVKGRVLKVYPKEDRVLVEGANLKLRHTRPSGKNPEGGRIQREHSMHISNVALANPDAKESLKWSSLLTSRVGYKIEASGKKIRYLKRTGKVLNHPSIVS